MRAASWPGAEVPATAERGIGHLGLDDQDVADLLAFLTTLTDEPRSCPDRAQIVPRFVPRFVIE